MDEFKKGIVNVTRSMAKGTGTFFKTTKLSLDLSNEESNMKSLYIEIGKKVHEIYSYGGSLGEYFDKRYRDILEQQNKIDSIREALEIAKGVKTCPKCGKTSPRVSVFCPKCGESIGDVPEVTAERGKIAPPAAEMHPAVNPPPESAGKLCNVCGAGNEAADRFCLSCGRIL